MNALPLYRTIDPTITNKKLRKSKPLNNVGILFADIEELLTFLKYLDEDLILSALI